MQWDFMYCHQRRVLYPSQDVPAIVAVNQRSQVTIAIIYRTGEAAKRMKFSNFFYTIRKNGKFISTISRINTISQ